MRRSDRLRHAANWLNLTTPVGLLVAGIGGARVRRGDHGLYVAEGYRFRFPDAGAFTIGDVVVTASTIQRLECWGTSGSTRASTRWPGCGSCPRTCSGRPGRWRGRATLPGTTRWSGTRGC
jgi:hypothetical protein